MATSKARKKPGLALDQALDGIIKQHKDSNKPLAVILAGHNGSGKSTLWYNHLVNSFRIPLVNADRMMMSILPEVQGPTLLPSWAITLRDSDKEWMQVAQKGVESFVAHAMGRKVPFAQETVFSYWDEQKDGTVRSKIDLITELQRNKYFVLLVFVGLRDAQLSIARVSSRKAAGGHDVGAARLLTRFPRTQKAISEAIKIADASILVDNSRRPDQAFTVARIQAKKKAIYDVRNDEAPVPTEISAWLDLVSPQP